MLSASGWASHTETRVGCRMAVPLSPDHPVKPPPFGRSMLHPHDHPDLYFVGCCMKCKVAPTLSSQPARSTPSPSSRHARSTPSLSSHHTSAPSGCTPTAALKEQVQCTAREPTHPCSRSLRLLRLHNISLRQQRRLGRYRPCLKRCCRPRCLLSHRRLWWGQRCWVSEGATSWHRGGMLLL